MMAAPEVDSIIILVLQMGKPRHREIPEPHPRGSGLTGMWWGHHIPLPFFFFFFLLFRAVPVACGSSQARGRIRAIAARHSHSHSNARSKL